MLSREAILWRMTNHPNVFKFMGLTLLDDAKRNIALVSQWMRHGNLLDFVQSNALADRADLVSIFLSQNYCIVCLIRIFFIGKARASRLWASLPSFCGYHTRGS